MLYVKYAILYATHSIFAEKVTKSKSSRNRLFYNAIRSVKSTQIQPIVADLISKQEMERKNPDWFELGNYIFEGSASAADIFVCILVSIIHGIWDGA